MSTGRNRTSLLDTMARGGSFCCVHHLWSFYGITGTHTLSIERVVLTAEKLGLHPATIRRWNKRIREGECKPCENCQS